MRPAPFLSRASRARLALVIAAGLAPTVRAADAQADGCAAERWVLIYSGGPHRPRYPIADLVPFLAVVDTTGTPTAWLSSGSVFLEFQGASGRPLTWAPRPPFASGQDWAQYLDSVFAPAGVIARLDSAVGAVAAALGGRSHPYDVAVMIPYPDPRAARSLFLRDTLDFSTRAGRLAGVDAYVREVQRRFAEARYRNLRLTGLYWLNEGISQADVGFISEVATLLHRSGSQLLWVPDFFDFTHKHWQRTAELGFDRIFVQPNYFIDSAASLRRIDSAFAAARLEQAGIEVEFDARLFSSPTFRARLEPYLAALRDSPDLLAKPLALYEGGGALPRLAHAGDPSLRAQYQSLARTFRIPEGTDGCH